MEESAAVAALAALAQPVRLRVFRALVGGGPDGTTPGALGTVLDVPPSSLSFHLKELVHAGLVSQERDGRTTQHSSGVPLGVDRPEPLSRCPRRSALPAGVSPGSYKA